MGIVQQVSCDLDGDGQVETVAGYSDGSTTVNRGANVLWRSAPSGWIDGWARRPWDIMVGCAVTPDGHGNVLIANNRDNYTGLMTWHDGALHVPWASPSPLHGPAGQWNRRPEDTFASSRWDGAGAVLVHHPQPDGWDGVLTWNGSALVPVQISKETARSGVLPFVLLKAAGINHYASDLPASIVPPGALVDWVQNTTTGAVVLTSVAMVLTHDGWPGQTTPVGVYGGRTYAFHGQPMPGTWECTLSGTGIKDPDTDPPTVLFGWYLP